MTLRIQFAIGVAVAAIVLPIMLVQAQSEGETEAPAAAEAIAQETEPATGAGEQGPQESEAAVSSEQDGSVLGTETSTETASSSEVTEDAASSDAAGAGDESAAAATSDESASTTPPDFLTLDTASSTASSTEPVVEAPVEEPKPIEEPFVLQPAVTLHVSGSSITADIELENLTCKSCEKVLPAVEVKAYHTPWYPNDGEVKEVGERVGEQAMEASDVALWASRSMTWSATDIAPGRYYFVVVVDPENVIGAYRMHRSEFSM